MERRIPGQTPQERRLEQLRQLQRYHVAVHPREGVQPLHPEPPEGRCRPTSPGSTGWISERTLLYGSDSNPPYHSGAVAGVELVFDAQLH